MAEFWVGVLMDLWEWKMVVILPAIIGLPVVWVLRLYFDASAQEIDRSCERTRQRTLADFAHKKAMDERKRQKATDKRTVKLSLGVAKERSEERRKAEKAATNEFIALLNQARGKNG